jgi:hypothetical protein
MSQNDVIDSIHPFSISLWISKIDDDEVFDELATQIGELLPVLN